MRTVAMVPASLAAPRTANAKTSERDAEGHVIHHPDPSIPYFMCRPLSHADQTLAGMRAHIGPHPEAGA